MSFAIVDCLSSASGKVNEDRAGAAHDFAWVIDGATDVVERPLTPAATDADWIAHHLDVALTALSATPSIDLSQVPELTAARLAADFAREASRVPIDKTEHPSASAFVVRARAIPIDILFVRVRACVVGF